MYTIESIKHFICQKKHSLGYFFCVYQKKVVLLHDFP